jgi:hypothetical protein
MKTFCFLFLLIIGLAISAQDIIILKNNTDTIHCKIIQDKIISIEYKLAHSADTNTYSVKTSETEGYIIGKYELNSDEYKQFLESYREIETQMSDKMKYISGFYLSFEDFINNTPSIIGEICREKRKRKSINTKNI